MFKNLYIINWLFENTKEPHDNIPLWQTGGSVQGCAGYFTIVNDGKNRIRIDIASVQARPTARIGVKFSSKDLGEVCVYEPLQKVFSLTKRYDSEDEAELAKTMSKLLKTIASQVAQKDLHDMDTEEERKQEIFRRLISGNT